MQEGDLGGRDNLGRKEKAGVSGAILSPEGGRAGGGLLDRCSGMPWRPWLPEVKSVCLGLREPEAALEGGPVVMVHKRCLGTHRLDPEPGGEN